MWFKKNLKSIQPSDWECVHLLIFLYDTQALSRSAFQSFWHSITENIFHSPSLDPRRRWLLLPPQTDSWAGKGQTRERCHWRPTPPRLLWQLRSYREKRNLMWEELFLFECQFIVHCGICLSEKYLTTIPLI